MSNSDYQSFCMIEARGEVEIKAALPLKQNRGYEVHYVETPWKAQQKPQLAPTATLPPVPEPVRLEAAKTTPCEVCECPLLPAEACPICAIAKRYKAMYPAKVFEGNYRSPQADP